jgi:hypothetical protein
LISFYRLRRLPIALIFWGAQKAFGDHNILLVIDFSGFAFRFSDFLME